MSNQLLGKGSEFYLGANDTDDLVLSDLLSNLKVIGAITRERNVIDVDTPIDKDDQEAIKGVEIKSTFTVTGDLKSEADNASYDKLFAAYESDTKVKFGIVRPGGLPGVGGHCLVHKVEVGEVTREGILSYSVDITTTGPKTVFVKPTV